MNISHFVLYFVLVFDESTLRYDFHYVPIFATLRFDEKIFILHSFIKQANNKAQRTTNKKAKDKKTTTKKHRYLFGWNFTTKSEDLL